MGYTGAQRQFKCFRALRIEKLERNWLHQRDAKCNLNSRLENERSWLFSEREKGTVKGGESKRGS